MRFLKTIFKIVITLIPVEGVFHFIQKCAARCASLQHAKEWRFRRGEMPLFYKHDLNLYRWRRNPELWSFTSRGVVARNLMTPGVKVLDLCSGDGSYGYLFYSDIASEIHAIDINTDAINYAKKNFSRENIKYFQKDLTRDSIPGSGYDFVVFNAGMYYFKANQVVSLLESLKKQNSKKFILVGNVPMANGHSDHQFEFKSSSEVVDFLKPLFSDVSVSEIYEKQRISFQFVAK